METLEALVSGTMTLDLSTLDQDLDRALQPTSHLSAALKLPSINGKPTPHHTPNHTLFKPEANILEDLMLTNTKDDL